VVWCVCLVWINEWATGSGSEFTVGQDGSGFYVGRTFLMVFSDKSAMADGSQLSGWHGVHWVPHGGSDFSSCNRRASLGVHILFFFSHYLTTQGRKSTLIQDKTTFRSNLLLLVTCLVQNPTHTPIPRAHITNKHNPKATASTTP
jgi:hypothetical protein